MVLDLWWWKSWAQCESTLCEKIYEMSVQSTDTLWSEKCLRFVSKWTHPSSHLSHWSSYAVMHGSLTISCVGSCNPLKPEPKPFLIFNSPTFPFHIIPPIFPLHSQLTSCLRTVQFSVSRSGQPSGTACVQYNSWYFNRHLCPGYLIFQWEWSLAAICSHLLLFLFNYTVLIGFASMMWSQTVVLGEQSTGTELNINFSSFII